MDLMTYAAAIGIVWIAAGVMFVLLLNLVLYWRPVVRTAAWFSFSAGVGLTVAVLLNLVLTAAGLG